jgi:hypothetical protein
MTNMILAYDLGTGGVKLPSTQKEANGLETASSRITSAIHEATITNKIPWTGGTLWCSPLKSWLRSTPFSPRISFAWPCLATVWGHCNGEGWSTAQRMCSPIGNQLNKSTCKDLIRKGWTPLKTQKAPMICRSEP